MSSTLDWTNLYSQRDGIWLKGNLHTHTTESFDGEIAPEHAIEQYKRMGYDYLSITDHNRKYTPPAQNSVIIQLAGIEVDFDGRYHIGVIHHNPECIVDDPTLSAQELIDRNTKNECLVILYHPNWTLKEHYTKEDLKTFRNYTGIEIYNSKIERLEGSALATDKWDYLLSARIKVLGFATQDSHQPSDYKDCCTVVRSVIPDSVSVLEALKSGNSYCYYGVDISDLGRVGKTIFIKTVNAQSIRFVGFGGAILKEINGRDGEMNFSDNDPTMSYIRIECLGKGKDISWSQPFFKNE